MKKLIFIALIGTLILSSCGGNTSNKPANRQTKVDNWYKGGTLHKAKISDWKTATDKNKLATCADFMATVDNSLSMDELKRRAKSLMSCIDESTKGIDNTNNESVSTIAALCLQLMGY